MFADSCVAGQPNYLTQQSRQCSGPSECDALRQKWAPVHAHVLALAEMLEGAE